MKNRKRETCTSGTVRDEDGNILIYSARPHEGGAAHTAGPAYANLQGRKPRDVGRGGASDAMGISAWVVCCRCALSACLGSGRRGDELGRPIAIDGTAVAQWGSNNTTAIQDDARASLFIAGREPAKQKGRTGVPRIDSDHDVSILITAVDAAGR